MEKSQWKLASICEEVEAMLLLPVPSNLKGCTEKPLCYQYCIPEDNWLQKCISRLYFGRTEQRIEKLAYRNVVFCCEFLTGIFCYEFDDDALVWWKSTFFFKKRSGKNDIWQKRFDRNHPKNASIQFSTCLVILFSAMVEKYRIYELFKNVKYTRCSCFTYMPSIYCVFTVLL